MVYFVGNQYGIESYKADNETEAKAFCEQAKMQTKKPVNVVSIPQFKRFNDPSPVIYDWYIQIGAFKMPVIV